MATINENERFFGTIIELLAHLQTVESVTKWEEVNSDFTEFSVSVNNNPFPQLGGDEFGVNVSFDYGYTKMPLRHTALNSILARADVSGRGVKRLFDSDKEKFCRHLNDYFDVKPESRKIMLALIQDDKLSALHSGNYARIPLTEIFYEINEYLKENYDGVTHLASYWSWEYTEARYEIRDEYFSKVYTDLLSKYFSDSDFAVQLRVISSDVSESAVRVYPYVLNGSRIIPLAGTTTTRHYGNEANISKVKEGFGESFIKFEASCRSLAALADVSINNQKNTMIKAFTWLRIPQKYASDLCEKYDNGYLTNALSVYTAMSEVLDSFKAKGMSDSEILRYEEQLCKMLTINERKWKSFDVSGVVAWNAKDK